MMKKGKAQNFSAPLSLINGLIYCCVFIV